MEHSHIEQTDAETRQMKKPKTKLDDYKRWLRERTSITREIIQAGIKDKKEIAGRSEELRKKYETILNEDDCYEFDTAEEMRKFLIDAGGKKNIIDKLMEHEIAHAAVTDPGHRVVYGFWRLDNGTDDVHIAPFATIVPKEGSFITEQERAKIVSAPIDPSETDF